MGIGPWNQQTQQVRRECAHPGTLRSCRSAFNVDCTYWWNSVWRKSTRDPSINLLSNWITCCLETIMNVSIIRRAAYLRSLNRGLQPGKELEDWLAAEQEIDHLIACGAVPYS
jgi:hypothetical protein